MLDLRSPAKSERVGDSAARRARRPARVCGNCVLMEGVSIEDEKSFVIELVGEAAEVDFSVRAMVVNRVGIVVCNSLFSPCTLR